LKQSLRVLVVVAGSSYDANIVVQSAWVIEFVVGISDEYISGSETKLWIIKLWFIIGRILMRIIFSNSFSNESKGQTGL